MISGEKGGIHPTAIIDPHAEIADGVSVGPYSVVGPDVKIGRGTRLGPHVVVEGRTTLGEDNQIFQFSALGAIPQDLKYKGEPSELRIGSRNQIREFTTLHPGTEGGGNLTTVGDDNLIMNFSHVAHDCHLGSHIVMANGATLAGHITVEDYVIIGGLAAVHQFVTVGESAMLGGGAMVVQDVPRFTLVQGDRAGVVALNSEGLRRRGFDADAVAAVKQAYRTVFMSAQSPRVGAEAVLAGPAVTDLVRRFAEFVLASERGVCRPRSKG